MRRLVLTAQAVDDLADIHDAIATASAHTEIADHFIDEIEARCLDIARLSSRLGRPRPEFGHDLRSLPHGNYLIFLRYRDRDTVEVVTVIHASRDLDAVFDDRSGA
jgi:toxin ParE1/3/4